MTFQVKPHFPTGTISTTAVLDPVGVSVTPADSTARTTPKTLTPGFFGFVTYEPTEDDRSWLGGVQVDDVFYPAASTYDEQDLDRAVTELIKELNGEEDESG
jgi:hypothetical protein